MRLTPLIRLSVAACALVLVVGAADGSADRSAGATARAWAIKVIVPGQPDAGTAVLAAPEDAVSFDGAFAYPTDGSVVAATSVTTSVSATSGTQASSGASSQVTALSLFKGEITAATLTGETHALASTASASGDIGATGIDTLVVLGQPVTPTANQQISLADWGYAIALEQKSQRVDKPTPGYHDFVTALDVFLTADHGGLPAGSELQIGYAEANAQASEAPPLPKAPSTPTITIGKTGKAPAESGPNGLPPVLSQPPNVTPKLTAGGYVFPVYGNSSFIDTFGAARGDVSGGWHHGDDIFAALGTPLLAVADGTVFSVGWNKVGGWRLWLRDNEGNEFYYAHLSAYSPLAVNGAIVHAGDVLGFLGDSGDAQGTPYHLHFEVHPVGLLGLGYDGAVDPTSYLQSWERLKDVRFDAVAGWTPMARPGDAPKAGAILLQSSDISTASGLDPASIDRALSSKTEGYGGPLTPQAQQPSAKPVVTTP
ncbi:MAG: peptidoglycan LD-endopeptidase LytH [Gaiellaceae bacterium]|nr:peptidoglycan LD-endopeptidase LytH [Gaiellaceae bacterium]MDX6471424.1 peptidoglycan LD-endopeptidase LytH [Gaiellaceae bacterium]